MSTDKEIPRMRRLLGSPSPARSLVHRHDVSSIDNALALLSRAAGNRGPVAPVRAEPADDPLTKIMEADYGERVVFDGEGSFSCNVCYENRQTHYMLSCGHARTCIWCLQQVYKTKPFVCPDCRAEVTSCTRVVL